MALKQLFHTEPKGNNARSLTALAELVSGIVQAGSRQMPAIASYSTGKAVLHFG